MTSADSILDKIIQSRHHEEELQFDPQNFIAKFQKPLSDKERMIINKRFGLNGEERQTLEEIGKNFNITRERIRQIQNIAINKIQKQPNFSQEIEPIANTITRLLQRHGGLMEEKYFLEELSKFIDRKQEYNESLIFIVSQLLTEKISEIKNDEKLLNGWRLKSSSLDLVYKTVEMLEELISNEKDLQKMEEIINKFRNAEFYKTNFSQLLPAVIGESEEENASEEHLVRLLKSFLVISRNIDQNILGEWGLTEWETIKPRRMGDKIFLIMKKVGKPLHFSEITTHINDEVFDDKVAYPATIHNELILDDRYVLVGRGIYALKEWGYESGTVSDIIEKILKAAGEPMDKDAITEAVLKQRLVRKSTIYLALTNKNKFKKVNNKYTLADSNTEPSA